MTENASTDLPLAGMPIGTLERASGAFLDDLERRVAQLEDRVRELEVAYRDLALLVGLEKVNAL